MSILSNLLRKNFTKGDAARDAGLTTPEDVARFDNIPYGSDPKWQLLDVYRPKAAGDTPLPVIVSVHGGGWVYGDKEAYQFYCMNLAQRGFAVVNFSYRLAPEHKFPAQLEDTNAVFHWILDHADEHGFDRDHIFGVGDSAGASILGLYTAACADPDYAARFPFHTPAGFIPRAVALNCGQYRFAVNSSPKWMTRFFMGDYLPGKGTPEELETIDVTVHVTEKFPPAFLMGAYGDFLKEQVPLLARRLEELGVPCVSRCYGDENNKLGHIFHCDIKSPDARVCNDEECAFFKSFS